MTRKHLANASCSAIARSPGLRIRVSDARLLRQVIRITLDTSAVREAMGQKWCDDRSRMANVTTFRVTVKRAALADLAA